MSGASSKKEGDNWYVTTDRIVEALSDFQNREAIKGDAKQSADANSHAKPHLGLSSSDDEKDSRNDGQAEKDIPHFERRSDKKRFDKGHKDRCQRHATGSDGRIRQLDRAIKSQPVRGHDQADSEVRGNDARRQLRDAPPKVR